MTFAKSDGVLSRFSRPPNSRAALALAHMVSDSQIWEKIIPSEPSKLSGTATRNYLDTLFEKDKDCQGAWEAYTKVTTGFPLQLSKGTASLTGFRHYSIQDAIYLEYYVRVRLKAIGTVGDTVSVDEIRKFTETAKPDLDYATGLQVDCEQKLGVPLEDIKKESKSARLDTSIAHFEKVVKGEYGPAKPWVDIHFALLPCIKASISVFARSDKTADVFQGYYKIATDLLKDPTVVKNTVYYTMWIQGNTDAGFVKDYDDFLQKAVSDATPDDWKRWAQIFKTACENEQNFFKLATEDYKNPPQPYNIVETGSYTISPHNNDGHFLNVVDGVVTVTTNSTKWELQNGLDGYTIKNATAQTFISVSIDGKGLPYTCYEVQTSVTAKGWPINPISVYDKDGNIIKGYQLFAPESLEFVLDCNSSSSKVFVANNYQGPSQTWILTKVS